MPQFALPTTAATAGYDGHGHGGGQSAAVGRIINTYIKLIKIPGRVT
jgi:hypothetical protein